MKSKLSTLVLGGLLTAVVGPLAHAGVVTYNFAGADANLGDFETFTSSGVSIDVYGLSWLDFTTFASADIVRVNDALGVRNSQDSNNQIDDLGSFDLLAIQITNSLYGPLSIDFSGIGADDGWMIAWASDLVGLNTSTPTTFFASSNILGTATGTGSSFSFAPVNLGVNWLFIGGTSLRGSGNNDFYVDRLRISTVAVPEPTTLTLLGAGLVGLAMIRRRKRV